MNATEEFLTEAFKQQGLVTEEMVAEVLEQAKDLEPTISTGLESLDFMNLLLDRLELSTDEVVGFLAAELQVEPIDLSAVNLSEEIASLLSTENARKYEALPLGTDGISVDLALGDPLDQDTIDNLTHLLGKSVNPRLAYRGDVIQAIAKTYGLDQAEKEKDFFDGLEGGEIQIEDSARPEDVSEDDAPIIKFVHSVIKDALEKRASDIHMEPLEKNSGSVFESMAN